MILRYLRQYGAVLVMLALFTGIFAAVFLLYGLPPEPVAYAAGLCVLLGGTAMALHFARYVCQHRERQRVCNAPALLLDQLPRPTTLIQEDDRAIMEELARQLRDTQTELRHVQQDSQDYFNAWVHQIKTPMAVMRLTFQSEDTDEHRAMLQELFHMEQYVDMALGYARLGNATKDLMLRQVALDGVIRGVIRDFAPLLIRRRIALRYEGTKEKALSDSKWLRFLLGQIMSNAVKYTSAGSVTVEVAPGPIVTVTDTGIGIAPEDVPRVFEKGYTGCNGRSGQKATGLGLFLTRQAADMLGHRVSLVSKVGEGTTVTVDLRRKRLDVE